MQFDFGQNWLNFSNRALTQEKIEAARKAFAALLSGVELGNRTFLDIGFGQGLSLLFAQEAGARVVGNDINPTCRKALSSTASTFGSSVDFPIVIGSILDSVTLDKLASLSPGGKGFDIVHSWGVLHHTGDMKTAIKHAASLVGNGGFLVCAIYNRHSTSSLWHFIKLLYCLSPGFLRKILVGIMFPVIAFSKFAVTGKNPFLQQRGMDFYYNVVDWIGGYPYEYAGKNELVSFLETLGFSCVKFTATEVPTGCNEFVFTKDRGASSHP